MSQRGEEVAEIYGGGGEEARRRCREDEVWRMKDGGKVGRSMGGSAMERWRESRLVLFKKTGTSSVLLPPEDRDYESSSFYFEI